MVLPLAIAAAAAFSMSTTADTTIAARPGTSIQVATFAGDVTVSAWEKDLVRVTSSDPEDERFHVKTAGGKILVKTDESWVHGRSVDLRLIVPAWMNLDISGVNTDVQITGTRGRVRVETINGDIVVKGGRGQIELSAVTQDICLTDASGRVVSQTVNGDLTFQRIVSDSVEASTVNGGIFYDGSIRDRGVYRFTSHDGDVAIALPKTVNATVSVSTFSGDFASDFPVSLSESKPGKQFCFSLGRGSAKVELESFQGTIHLFRPGALSAVIEAERGSDEIKARAEKARLKAHKAKREYGGEREERGNDEKDDSDSDSDDGE